MPDSRATQNVAGCNADIVLYISVGLVWYLPLVERPAALLEQWVEHGRAPALVIATHANNGFIDRSHPLCPYPKVAAHDGQGDPNDAASFTCRLPEPRRGR